MSPVVERHDALLLAGLSALLPPRSAPPFERPRVIQELWRSLMPRAAEIRARRGSDRYSVIENDVLETDATPIVRAMVAVDSFDGLPAWCERYTVAPGRFAIFEHRGAPKDLSKTVAGIYATWQPKIPGLFTLDWEVMRMPATYDPADPNGVFEYWVPLPGK